MPDHLMNIQPETVTCSGFCRDCGEVHEICAGPALEIALELMREIEARGRIDLDRNEHEADPRFSLDYLTGPARGQMFGVLAHEDKNGIIGSIKAFSGQYNGSWLVPGWVPPVLDVNEFHRIGDPVEAEIKRLGREISALPKGDPERARLTAERKTMSQSLMRKFHDLYQLRSTGGKTRSMTKVFTDRTDSGKRAGNGLAKGLPTGTGDCCSPKLLQYAALHGLKPLGLTELYMGRENRSRTREHGRFYASCAEKCQPIMGFMLCPVPPWQT